MSPAMHNRAFSELGMAWRYLALEVAPESVPNAVQGLKALGFAGANVTVPHKQSVLPYLDELSPGAAAIGAVNTVVIHRPAQGAPRAVGHNTDVDGAMAALRRGGIRPSPASKVVVVGAGGASRAVVHGLRNAGVHDIVVLDLELRRAEQLVVQLGQGDGRVAAMAMSTLVEVAQDAELLVNATPVGMAPASDASVWPENASIPEGMTVFDLVYNPRETQLLRQARRAGVTALGGLEMLVQQGAYAFSHWTGEPDLDRIAALMRDAAEQALGEHS